MTSKRREIQRKRRVIEYAESEFQAMLEEIKVEMAARLGRVREMQRGGELEAIPRDGGASQHGLGPR
jgi:hypothetical protein